VDYLLKENGVKINSVYIKLTDEKIECKIADEVSKKGVPVSGFGCSDCSCKSHLFRVLECDFLSEFGLSKIPVHKFL
jgi:Uri superfamily endonuclease